MEDQHMENRQPPVRPRRKAARIACRVIIIASVAVLAVGGIRLLNQRSEAEKTKDYYASIQQETPPQESSAIREAFALMDGDSELTAEEKTALAQAADARNQPDDGRDADYARKLAENLSPSSGNEGKVSSMDFTALRQENEDVAAWVKIDGSAIDYPVAQGTDNDFYLSHRFDGQASKSGAIFVDYRNAKGFADQNTILYGHHMKNGSMFAPLVNYKAQDFYDAHPVMLLYTPEGDYLVEFFAGYVVPIRNEALPCFYMSFSDEAEYLEYIAEAKRRSTFQSEVAVGAEDRIVTLATCTYEVYDARYVLQGKLTPLAGIDER